MDSIQFTQDIPKFWDQEAHRVFRVSGGPRIILRFCNSASMALSMSLYTTYNGPVYAIETMKRCTYNCGTATMPSVNAVL